MSLDGQRRIVIRNLPWDTTELEFIEYLRSRKSCQQYFEADPPLAVLTSFKSGKAANPLKERGDVHATAFVVVESVQVAQNIAAALDSIAYRPDVQPNLLIAVEYSPYQDAATFEDLPSTAANPAAGSILIDDEYLAFVRDVVEKTGGGSKAPANAAATDSTPGDAPGLTRASALEVWLAEQKTKDEAKLNTALVSALLGKWYHKKPFGWERRKAEQDAKDRSGKDAVIEEEERIRKEKELRRIKKDKKREERRENKRREKEEKRVRKEAAKKEKSEKNGADERRPRRRKRNADGKGAADAGKDSTPAANQPVTSNPTGASPKHSKAELREEKNEKQHRRDRHKEKKASQARPELRTKEDEILDKQRQKDEKKQRMKDKAEKERRMKATIEEANTRKELSNSNAKGETTTKRNTFSVSTTKKLASNNGGRPSHTDALNFPTLGHCDDERPPAAASGVWRGKQGDSSDTAAAPPPPSAPSAPAPKRMLRRETPRHDAAPPPAPPAAL